MPTISTRRAYLEVLGVFAIFFGAGVINAVLILAKAYPAGSTVSWGEAVSVFFSQNATTALCILVPILLIRQRGVTTRQLGLVLPPGPSHGVWTGIRMATWGYLSIFIWAIIVATLGHPALPTTIKNGPYFLAEIGHLYQAGFIEEIVVLGFTVITLEQARRPRWEIIAVALLLRDSYHIYYGWGALFVPLWAGTFLWLFLRFRSLVPLIAIHSFWDVTGLVASYSKGATAVLGCCVLLMMLVAVISFLASTPTLKRRGSPTKHRREFIPTNPSTQVDQS
jgi:hypothetical protein